jgi:hypothetical protein
LHKPQRLAHLDRITEAFDRNVLRTICQMDEADFVKVFDMEKTGVTRPYKKWRPIDPTDDFYAFRDNGSSVLAVAHLDTVVYPDQRQCGFLDTAGGTVVYSGALDDRLGAYVLLDLLPKLDINVDLLLTVGEESGQSTAEFFEPPKDYNWIIEFDRGGTDVVMYQFEDEDTRDMVRLTGARVGEGIFSDICYLEHLGVKAFNWGVGYEDYHSVRSHAYLEDLFQMVNYFVDFHDMWADEHLPHEADDWSAYGRLSGDWGGGWDESDIARINDIVLDDDDEPIRGIDDVVPIEDIV